jgi:hypothetical protein
MFTKQPNLTELAKKKINDLDTDYKQEVIAAALIEQGVDPDAVIIARKGIARRGIGKEVEHIYTNSYIHDYLETIHIEVNKEGLYDMLPQGLFHRPNKKITIEYKEDILEDIRIHRSEEFFARKFFQLFELVADRTFIKIYQAENRFDRKQTYPEFVDIFKPYWHVLEKLTLKQGVTFMYIIPFLEKIRTEYSNIEQVLSYIIEAPVKIAKIKLPEKKVERMYESTIGEACLNVDFVLGKQFDDGEYDLQITIGAISAQTMKNYLVTSEGYIVLQMLCDIFLPEFTFPIFNFIINPADSEFILSYDERTTYLGINSFI